MTAFKNCLDLYFHALIITFFNLYLESKKGIFSVFRRGSFGNCFA